MGHIPTGKSSKVTRALLGKSAARIESELYVPGVLILAIGRTVFSAAMTAAAEIDGLTTSCRPGSPSKLSRILILGSADLGYGLAMLTVSSVAYHAPGAGLFALPPTCFGVPGWHDSMPQVRAETRALEDPTGPARSKQPDPGPAGRSPRIGSWLRRAFRRWLRTT